jgi:hypothetical protein
LYTRNTAKKREVEGVGNGVGGGRGESLQHGDEDNKSEHESGDGEGGGRGGGGGAGSGSASSGVGCGTESGLGSASCQLSSATGGRAAVEALDVDGLVSIEVRVSNSAIAGGGVGEVVHARAGASRACAIGSLTGAGNLVKTAQGTSGLSAANGVEGNGLEGSGGGSGSTDGAVVGKDSNVLGGEGGRVCGGSIVARGSDLSIAATILACRVGHTGAESWHPGSNHNLVGGGSAVSRGKVASSKPTITKDLGGREGKDKGNKHGGFHGEGRGKGREYVGTRACKGEGRGGSKHSVRIRLRQ